MFPVHFDMKNVVLAQRKLPVFSVCIFKKFSPRVSDNTINVHRRGAIHNSSFSSQSIFFQFFIVFIAFQHLVSIKAMFVFLHKKESNVWKLFIANRYRQGLGSATSLITINLPLRNITYGGAS